MDLKRRQVVHYHDVVGARGRHEHRRHLGAEGGAVHRAVDEHRRDETARGEAGGEDGGLPIAVRHRGPAALALWRPSAQARHLSRRADLVDEDELVRLEIELAAEPGLAGRFHIRRCCSAACASFFIRDPAPVEEPPYGGEVEARVVRVDQLAP